MEVSLSLVRLDAGSRLNLWVQATLIQAALGKMDLSSLSTASSEWNCSNVNGFTPFKKHRWKSSDGATSTTMSGHTAPWVESRLQSSQPLIKWLPRSPSSFIFCGYKICRTSRTFCIYRHQAGLSQSAYHIAHRVILVLFC